MSTLPDLLAPNQGASSGSGVVPGSGRAWEALPAFLEPGPAAFGLLGCAQVSPVIVVALGAAAGALPG
ncbi:MAG: hypothetical protein JNJ89_05710 [Rubrivivax sp.]|nr:hypothetical protein [Rubrivivax sp.]